MGVGLVPVEGVVHDVELLVPAPHEPDHVLGELSGRTGPQGTSLNDRGGAVGAVVGTVPAGLDRDPEVRTARVHPGPQVLGRAVEAAQVRHQGRGLRTIAGEVDARYPVERLSCLQPGQHLDEGGLAVTTHPWLD